jgi:TatA/E family protein of Tat protein translocase
LFGGGFLEIGFFLFIAYLLFGPKKVPEIARVLGKGLGELRRASNELRNSLEEEIKNLDRLPESGHDKTSTYGHHDPEPTPEETGPRS